MKTNGNEIWVEGGNGLDGNDTYNRTKEKIIYNIIN